MKIFLPLLDNGNGAVMSSFMICHARAFAGRDCQLTMASDSHANRGMNKIANDFLRSDCDVWVNLDADIHFTPRDVDHLLSHGPDVPLVYGIYPKKQEDAPPCLCTFAELPVPDARSLARVRRCGRGFMLVRRELLEAMKEDNGGPALRYHNHDRLEWDFFPSGPVAGEMSALEGLDEDGYPRREWISEDWYFCERARALGVPTLVDVRIALGHEGRKVYRLDVARTDWQSVPGWFSEADAECYRRIARELPEGGQFAEVGCWMGRSLCAFTTFLTELGKGAGLHAIDTFKGTQTEPNRSIQQPTIEEHGGSLRRAFERNLQTFGAGAQVYEMDSLAAASCFADGFLDAVFIDGDHSYDAVRADLAAWLPKVKPGGIIAGHDYDEAEVAQAVAVFFPGQIERIGDRCWFVRL